MPGIRNVNSSTSSYGIRARYVIYSLVAALVISACSAQVTEQFTSYNPHKSTEELAADALGNRVMFGAFTLGGVWQGIDPILRVEADIGRRLDIVHWFTNWDNPFYPELAVLASQGGRIPMISWQPHRQSVSDIAAGRYDEYIRDWARGAATAPDLVYVRPFPEMNGSWAPWNGNTDTFKAAWQRIVNIFDQEGADNVRWVFSPNVSDEPRTEANRMENYYPGRDYVDVLALDGYNWGNGRPYIGWRTFTQVFQAGYDRITALGDQPVWIAEVASGDKGGDKAAWVAEMFATTGFDRIEALVWFDQDKEEDWRIASHLAVVDAFRSALAAGTSIAATGRSVWLD